MWNVVWRNGSAMLLAAWLGAGCASQRAAEPQSVSVPSVEGKERASNAEPLLVTIDAAGIVVGAERLEKPDAEPLRGAFARHRTGASQVRVVVGEGATWPQLAALLQAARSTDLSSFRLETGEATFEVPVKALNREPTHTLGVTNDGGAWLQPGGLEASSESTRLLWSPGDAEAERAQHEKLLAACSTAPCRISAYSSQETTLTALIAVLASFEKVAAGVTSLEWEIRPNVAVQRLPPSAIQAVVREHFGVFRRCYELGLARNPALTGLVRTRFVIGRDGKVSNVADAGSDIPDPEVVDCVLKAFYELVFPVPDGGIVTVVYPIMLAPG